MHHQFVRVRCCSNYNFRQSGLNPKILYHNLKNFANKIYWRVEDFFPFHFSELNIQFSTAEGLSAAVKLPQPGISELQSENKNGFAARFAGPKEVGEPVADKLASGINLPYDKQTR